MYYIILLLKEGRRIKMMILNKHVCRFPFSFPFMHYPESAALFFMVSFRRKRGEILLLQKKNYYQSLFCFLALSLSLSLSLSRFYRIRVCVKMCKKVTMPVLAIMIIIIPCV
jgi:hypothetical protein